MIAQTAPVAEYDTVELRTGRLYKLHRSAARALGDDDRMVQVAKCYCRSHDVITAADADEQRRPTFVFPVQYFSALETLIGKELQGRIYADSQGRRVRFYLDLKEHAGFQMDDEERSLHSPWYDDSVLKE